MSWEASINMYRELVAIHEGKLKDLRERKEDVERVIAVVEQDLEHERQKLVELESEGGSK